MKFLACGHSFPSEKSANLCKLFQSMKEEKKIFDYDVHKKIILQEAFDSDGIHFREIAIYADFIIYKEGQTEIIIVKDKDIRTSNFVLKLKMLYYKYNKLGYKVSLLD